MEHEAPKKTFLIISKYDLSDAFVEKKEEIFKKKYKQKFKFLQTQGIGKNTKVVLKKIFQFVLS